MTAATAKMPAAATADASAAPTRTLAAPRRDLRAIGALGLLAHAVAVAGVA